MKIFKPTVILLVLLLAAMVIVPMVSAAPDAISPDKIKTDTNFVNVDKATSVANTYVKQFSSSFTDYADWKGATVKKVTTYYDLNGKESAYSFDVLVKGQYAGYLMVSATRENYPVLEFSKGKTPDREITTQNNAKTLAATNAKSQQATLGDGRPLYLGATFYYMQYPVQKTGMSKGTTQTSQDTILVDLHENKVVDLKNTATANSLMRTTDARANADLDEKNFADNQMQMKQESEAQWIALDNLEKQQRDLTTKQLSKTTVSEKNIDAVEVLGDNPEGCTPTAAAMVLGYYRDWFNCKKFPLSQGNGNPPKSLKEELHDAMKTTDPDGLTSEQNVKPGLDTVINNHGYQFNTIHNSAYNYNSGKTEIDQGYPYVLSMMYCVTGNPYNWYIPYGSHSVTVTGYRETSFWGIPVNYVIVNDAVTHRGVNIYSGIGGWLRAYSFYVHPISYTVTTTSGPNGNIDQPSQEVIGGADSNLITATANTGYVIDSIVLSNGTTISPAANKDKQSFTIYNVSQDLVVTATFTPSVCSMLTFTDANFRSDAIQYFNSNNTIPAGNYTLNVTGWNSQWSYDMGWWEEGVTTQASKSAVWNNMTNLWVEGEKTPLSTIVTGEFAREDSWGSALVNISSPSRVGIVLVDNPYYDNRGAATFVLRNAGQTCPATAMKQSVNVLPSIAADETGMVTNETFVERINE